MKHFLFLCAIVVAGCLHGYSATGQHSSGTRPEDGSRTNGIVSKITQYKVSEAMGKDNPAYHFDKTGQLITAGRFTTGLTGEVSPDGVIFRSGSFHWSVGLAKIMNVSQELEFDRYTAMLRAVPENNRLELHGGTISEWK